MKKREELLLLCALLRPAGQDEIEGLREKIVQKRMPWVDIIALANNEYLVPALCSQLEKKGVLEAIEDEQLKGYLHALFAFNTERNLRIRRQLEDLVSVLEPLDIVPCFLKGAVVLSEEDYPSLGMRSMTDIDVMVNEKELMLSFEALQRSGYSFVRSEDEHKLGGEHHHLEAMRKDGMPAALELHRHVLGGEASAYVAYLPENRQKSSNPLFSNVDILRPTYRLYHAFLHTEIQHGYHKNKYLALRHIFDFSLLAQKYSTQVDWELLRQLAVSNRCIGVLEDYLYLCKMLFLLETPLTVENRRTRRHYAMMLTSFDLEGSILGKLYPPGAKLSGMYSYKKLQKHYAFSGITGYLGALARQIGRHSRKYLLKKAE